MRPLELLVLYLAMGLGVAVAVQRVGRPGAALAVPFWPLFLPTLLQSSPGEAVGTDSAWMARIHASTCKLAEALAAWEGLPAASQQRESLRGLSQRLEGMAARLAQLDAVLAAPDLDPATLAAAREAASPGSRSLVEARAANVARLVALRDQSRADLEHALALLDDLAVRAALARFTGDAVESVAAELRSLSAAVDTGGELARLVRGEVIRPLGQEIT